MNQDFLTPGCSLRQLILDLNSIHAAKNQREQMFTTPLGCLVFIAGALKAISSEITKHHGQRLTSLVSVFTKRLFTLVGVWGIDQFLATLQIKYPASGCSYCHELPCACGSSKNAPWKQVDNIQLNPDQAKWSLGDWQSHHLRVYGVKNTDLSPDRLLGWLNEEFLETLLAIGWIAYAEVHHLPTTSGHEALATELPDLFMRTLAIANRHGGGFDVETFIINHYRDGCAKCRERYCVCPNHIADFDLFEHETMAATRVAK